MKTRLLSITSGVAVFLLACSLHAEGEPVLDPAFDWSVQSGEVVIPSGKIVVVNNADLADLNACSGVTVEDGAVLRFNTDSPSSGVVLKGAGAIEKVSSAAWILTARTIEFSGDYWILNGTVSTAVRAVFGVATATAAVSVHVAGQGTLIIPNATLASNMYQYERLCLSGSGYGGRGALVVNKGFSDQNAFQYVSLEDDALVSIAEGQFLWFRSKPVCLNGHALTLGGPATGKMGYQSTSFVGPGTVRLAQVGSTYRSWLFRLSSWADVELFPFVSERTRVLLEPNTGIDFYVDENGGRKEFKYPVEAELAVTAGVAVVSHSHRYTAPDSGCFDDNTAEWSGPVSLLDSDAVLCAQNAASCNCQLEFGGKISGDGGFSAGSSSVKTTGRILLGGDANDFGGPVTAYGTAIGSLGLVGFGSIPDYSRLTVNGGLLSLLLTDDRSSWSDERIVEIANSATWNDGACLSFDASRCTNAVSGELALSAELLASITKPVGLAAEYGARLTLTGSLGCLTNRYVASHGGAVVVSGATAVTVGACTVGGTPMDDGTVSELRFKNAGDVRRTDAPIEIGTTSDGIGRLVLDRAVVTSGLPSSGLSDITSYGIVLGTVRGGEGSLEVGEGSALTNRLVVGYAAGGAGAVRQSGGDVFSFGDPSSSGNGQYRYGPTVGYHGLGALEISGGTHTMVGRAVFGYAAPAVVHMTGGECRLMSQFSSDDAFANLGFGAAAPVDVYVAAGTFNADNAYTWVGHDVADYRTTITVDGPTACFSRSGSSYAWHIGWGAGGGRLNLNLNDGVFKSSPLQRRDGKDSVRKTPDWVLVNFNGGTFQCDAASAATPFPEARSKNYCFRLSVYEKGATFDSNGKNVTLAMPFVAASGNGVVSVPLPAAVSSATFTAPPVVLIDAADGDVTGDGATAHAVFDSLTGKVTGVLITSHGFDYTAAPTAKFYTGKTSDSACLLASSVCAIAPNGSGSFTKKGVGTLTLSATNTYAGATVLAGGTLKLGVDNAIPAASRIVLAGGTLDMNGKTLGDGTISQPVDFGVSVPFVLENGTVSYHNFTFPAGATLTVSGVEVLPDYRVSRTIPLLKFTGTIPSALPQVAVEGSLPDGWSVRWGAGVLKAVPKKGCVLIFR